MKLEKHLERCFEQNICNISYVVPDKKKFNDWFMKTDLPI